MREITWKDLCKEIMHEQDPERLFALAQELNNLLEERNQGLEAAVPRPVDIPMC
jgi:hypothetical protein